MDDYFLNLIIAISTLLIAGLAFVDQFTAKFFRSLWFKWPILIICSYTIMWATNQKDFNAENQNTRDKLTSEIEQRKRDSTYNAKEKIRDSLSHQQEISDRDSVIAALGRYSLKFDSATNTITKVIKEDTSKRNVNIYHGTDPSVTICIKDVSKNIPTGLQFEKIPGTDSFKLNITLCHENGPENLSLAFYIIAYKNGKFTNVGGDILFYNKKLNFSNASIQQKMPVFDVVGKIDAETIYIYFIGSYTNRDGSKPFPIDVIYTPLPDGFGQPLDYMDQRIRAFIAEIK